MSETPAERAERLRADPFAMAHSIEDHYREQREKRAAEQQQEPK